MRRVLLAAIAVLAVALYSSVGEASAPQGGSPRVDFDKQIKPILAANCLECHSAEKRKGGLSLADYAELVAQGRGDEDTSALLRLKRGA